MFLCVSHQVDGISIGSLDDIPGTPVTNFFRSIRSTLDFDFEDENESIAKLQSFHLKQSFFASIFAMLTDGLLHLVMKIMCSYRFLGAQGATDPLYIYQLQHPGTLFHREVCGMGLDRYLV